MVAENWYSLSFIDRPMRLLVTRGRGLAQRVQDHDIPGYTHTTATQQVRYLFTESHDLCVRLHRPEITCGCGIDQRTDSPRQVRFCPGIIAPLILFAMGLCMLAGYMLRVRRHALGD